MNELQEQLSYQVIWVFSVPTQRVLLKGKGDSTEGLTAESFRSVGSVQFLRPLRQFVVCDFELQRVKLDFDEFDLIET